MTSESNEPASTEARLAAHVESILNQASFRRRDRTDLAEELYGHLWQHWQDALAAGLDDETAASQAIRSFGEPAQLGRDVTLAYHSRLYASTIGILIPNVAEPRDKPRAYWPVWLLFFTTFYAMAMGQAQALMSWTPLRAAIGFGGTLMAYLAACVVMYAFRRRQRWALGFARLELPLLCWWIAVLSWTGWPMLPQMAVGWGVGAGVSVLALSTSIRPRRLPNLEDLRPRSLKDWLYDRAVPRRLVVGLGVMLIFGSAAPVVALNVADPTQIGPADVKVALSVACGRDASGDVRTVAVIGSFEFDRTDLWPTGLVDALQGGGPKDEVALAVEGSRPGGIPMITPQLTRAATARDTTDGSPLTISSAGEDGRALWVITEGERLKARHRYEVSWNYTVAPGLRDIAPVTFGYDHLERFYLQATAGCDQTGNGQSVSHLYVIGP